jgi:hypothetical protein
MNGRTRWATATSESAADQDPAQQLKIQKLQQAASIVVNELPAIIDALVKKAKEGSYLHAKCAFELARISDLELPRQSRPEPWVEELLAALRALPNPAEPAAAS